VSGIDPYLLDKFGNGGPWRAFESGTQFFAALKQRSYLGRVYCEFGLGREPQWIGEQRGDARLHEALDLAGRNS
jgi:hypothetical protein